MATTSGRFGFLSLVVTACVLQVSIGGCSDKSTDVPSEEEFQKELAYMALESTEEAEQRLTRLERIKKAHPSFDLSPAYGQLLANYQLRDPSRSRTNTTFVTVAAKGLKRCPLVGQGTGVESADVLRRKQVLARKTGSPLAAEISFSLEDLQGWRSDRTNQRPPPRPTMEDPVAYFMRGVQLLIFQGRSREATAEAESLLRSEDERVVCGARLALASIAEDRDDWDGARVQYQAMLDEANDRTVCVAIADARHQALGASGDVPRLTTRAAISTPAEATVRAAFVVRVAHGDRHHPLAWHGNRVPAWGTALVVVASVKEGEIVADLPPGNWELQIRIDGPAYYTVEGTCKDELLLGSNLGDFQVKPRLNRDDRRRKR